MATAEHHENRREWALALESYRAAADVAAGGMSEEGQGSFSSSQLPYVEAVARAASVHHLTGMHVEGAATANSVRISNKGSCTTIGTSYSSAGFAGLRRF